MSSFRNLVILLPGITGSVLADNNGKELWSPSAGAIWRAITSFGDSIKELELEGDDVDDGVTAPRLIPDATIVPGLVKIDGYTRICSYLIDQLGLVEGENFRAFPYDWRRDNRVNAKRLQSQAMDWLKEWKVKSGADDARLVLIGHSMGGLIARYFLECLGGWQHTSKLITLGTPHRGSVNAIDFLVNGMKKGVGPFGLDLTPLLRSFTSVYQLLPIYPCVDVGSENQVRVEDAAQKGLLPWIEGDRAMSARAFHTEILTQQAINSKQLAYVENGYVAVPLVGIEQPTYQSTRVTDGKVELLRTWNGEDTGGDGTVPRGSATPIDLEGDSREIYCAETHGSLQNSDGVLANIRGILTRETVDFKAMRSADIPTALSLSVDDVIFYGDPLTVRVRPGEGSPPIKIKLTRLGSDEVIGDQLERDADGWQIGEYSLLAGTWRVEVDAERSSRATDLVIVAQR